MNTIKNIIILTAKNHIYSNLVLKKLIMKNAFNNKNICIIEQSCLIPGKSKFKGLFIYLKKSGFKYVIYQIIKQILFKIKSLLVKNIDSNYYKYYKLFNNRNNYLRIDLNNLKGEKVLNYIKKFKPDLIISIYSREIIPEKILKIPQYGCVNLHPSLLPFYRGVSPIFWILLNKDYSKIGITMHYVDKGIDTGNIIIQKKLKCDIVKNEHIVFMKCSMLAVDFLYDFINNIFIKEGIKQNIIQNNYYSIPNKIDVKNFLKFNVFFKISDFFNEL